MKKILIPALIILCCFGIGWGIGKAIKCSQADPAAEPQFEWQRVENHGQITGVTAITGDIDAAIGTFDGEIYTAPSGKVYQGGPVATVAKLIADAQPKLAYLKEVIGYSDDEYVAEVPESALGNALVDALRAEASNIWGVPMDFAITNIGGIRIDMPKGNILLDDLKAMFPFKNTVAYAKVRGRDLRKLLSWMAGTKIQPISGATIRVKGGKLVDARIGGKPIVDNKLYNVATIDFLLTGGDGIRINAMSEETKESDVLIQDFMIRHIRSLTAEGKHFAPVVDGRVKVEE